MFWIILLIVGFALVFFKLGSVSVWMSFLVLGVKITLVIIDIQTISLIWQKWKMKRTKKAQTGAQRIEL